MTQPCDFDTPRSAMTREEAEEFYDMLLMACISEYSTSGDMVRALAHNGQLTLDVLTGKTTP